MADSPHKIFISYSHDEVPFVSAVADELRLQGVESWFDETQLLAGTSWRERMANALASSKVVVVFLGARTQSPWMNFEIGAAVGGEKPVVPVYLTEAARRGAPSLLSHFVGIDAYDQKPDEVAQQIADVIRAA